MSYRFTVSRKKEQNLHRTMDWNEVLQIKSTKPWAVIRAREQKKLLGQVAVVLVDEEDSAYLYYFVVDPSCRGQGIGTALLQRTENWIKSQGYSKVVLYPQLEFESTLLPFYEELGYTKLKRDPENRGEFRMEKYL